METHKEIIYRKGRKQTIDVFLVSGSKIIIEGRFIKIARLKDEDEGDVSEPEALIKGLRCRECNADIFTFWTRVPSDEVKYPYLCEKQTQALLPVDTYELWWNKQIDKQVRKFVRRSIKLGVEAHTVEWNDELL